MDVFEKALRYLYEKQLEKLGLTADIIITKISSEEQEEEEHAS